MAISAGYRHIDGAYVYKNEKEIGTGIHAMINQGVVKREELFVISKVWYTSVYKPLNTTVQFNSMSGYGNFYANTCKHVVSKNLLLFYIDIFNEHICGLVALGDCIFMKDYQLLSR